MKLALPISLGVTTLALCLAANSRYEENQQLVTTPYKTPLIMLATASAVGTILSLKSCLSVDGETQQTPQVTKQNSVSKPTVTQPIETQETDDIWEQEYTEITQYTQTKPTEIKPQKDVLSRLLDFVLKKQGSVIYCAAETGAGKSTFLFKFLSELLIKTNGAAHISVIDAKGAYWPLRDYQDIDNESRVVLINSTSLDSVSEGINKAVNKLIAFDQERASRDQLRIELEAKGETANFSPMLLVIDEWLRLRSFAKSVDKSLLQEIEFRFENIVTLGREVGVHIFASGQSHRAGSTGIKTDYRHNLALIGFSSDDKAAIVESMISDPWVIPDGNIRAKVIDLANSFKSKKQKFSYCSLGSHTIEPMPVMSKSQNQTELTNLINKYYGNQPSEHTETENNPSNVIPFKKPTTDENIDYWRELNG